MFHLVRKLFCKILQSDEYARIIKNKIVFLWIKAHTGDFFNDKADELLSI